MDAFLVQHQAVNDIKNIYWDADGNLRCGKSSRDRDGEVLEILSGDASDETEEARLWMIVPSRWIRNWLLFAHLKIATDAPGPINMDSLLQRDETVDGGWRPKNTLLPPGKGAAAEAKGTKSPGTNKDKSPGTKTSSSNKARKEEKSEDFPGHYRRISLEAWLLLVDLYGLTEPGYALAVRGTPYHDLQRWRVFKNPRQIDAEILPGGDGLHLPKNPVAANSIAPKQGLLDRLFGSGSAKV